MFVEETKLALGSKYPVVTEPGPGVARLRFTIIGVTETVPYVSTATRVIPIGAAINLLSHGAGQWRNADGLGHLRHRGLQLANRQAARGCRATSDPGSLRHQLDAWHDGHGTMQLPRMPPPSCGHGSTRCTARPQNDHQGVEKARHDAGFQSVRYRRSPGPAAARRLRELRARGDPGGARGLGRRDQGHPQLRGRGPARSPGSSPTWPSRTRCRPMARPSATGRRSRCSTCTGSAPMCRGTARRCARPWPSPWGSTSGHRGRSGS